MARDYRRGVVETRTKRYLSDTPVDKFDALMKARMGDVRDLSVNGYLDRFWTKVAEPDARINIYKRVAGTFTKKGELSYQEIDPTDAEAWIVDRWQPGAYQLRPEYDGQYRKPGSAIFRFGEDDNAAIQSGDGEIGQVLATIAKSLGHAAQVKELKAIVGGEGDGGMKTEELATLITAVKTDMSPFTAMIEAANRRADAAEARNHELTMKLLDQRGTANQGMLPILGELLTKVKPEVIEALMSPQGLENPASWWDSLRELIREFGPAIQGALFAYMQKAGLPVPGQPALPAGDSGPVIGQPEPAPTGAAAGGGQAMPMQLNEEQQVAKGILLDCLKAGDFANAYAMLVNFPLSVPTPEGIVPFGDFLIGRIDPAVKPQVYLPQLMAIIPEFKVMMPQALAFVKHIQDRIVLEDEAARRREAAGPGGGEEPRPSGAGD